MNNLALTLIAAAAILFMLRMLRGPGLADRVISADGFISTVVIAVTIAAARPASGVVQGTVLLVALGGFVGTAILARFIERRGS